MNEKKEPKIKAYLVTEEAAGAVEIENTLDGIKAALKCDLIDIQERFVKGRLLDFVFDDEGALKDGLKICGECADYPERIAGAVLICGSGAEDGEEHSLTEADEAAIKEWLRKTEDGEKTLDGLDNERGLAPQVIRYTIRKPGKSRAFTISEKSAKASQGESEDFKKSITGNFATYEEAHQAAREKLRADKWRRVYFVQVWERQESGGRYLWAEYMTKQSLKQKEPKTPEQEIEDELAEIYEKPERKQRRRKAYEIAKATGKPYKLVLNSLNELYEREAKQAKEGEKDDAKQGL